MWKFLYQLASPRSFFHLSQKVSPYLGYLALTCLSLSFIWGVFWAPADYQQGDAFRIIYLHVPAAFMSLALYTGMAFAALLFLVWNFKLAGFCLKFTAELGATMSLLALLTGSIWGKPMWGAWWVWDARLTSELILFFIYLSLLTLSFVCKEGEKNDRLLAILTLIGFIDLPIIHYSVYWWNTLHQGATLSFFSKPKIALPMLYPLLLSLLGFMFYSLWFVLAKVSHNLLWRERKQGWVKNLMEQR